MIKIYLLDKKSSVVKTHEEYIKLPKSFIEIRKEAIKLYKWLRAIEKRYVTNNSELSVKVINSTKNEQGVAVFLETMFSSA